MAAVRRRAGELVGSGDLPAGAPGTPMTYLVDGGQFIAVAIGGDVPGLIAFALH